MRVTGKPLRLAAATLLMATAIVGSGWAQEEISDSHLKAARDVINSINATDEFDGILPAAAAELKVQLYQKNPDLQPMISAIVDETAIGLAGRRADLEREAAHAYAKVFSEAELKEITAFYTSSVGKKLIADGPIVTREIFRAADIWRGGIARDLAAESGKKIAEEAKKMNADAGGGAENDGEAKTE